MAKPKTSIISNINVVRLEKKDALKISWETETKDVSVCIFTGDSPLTINRKSPVAKVKGEKYAEITGLAPDVRNYFEIVPEGGKSIIVAERHVNFEGIVNFRDLIHFLARSFSNLYSIESTNACQEASMIFSETPTVHHESFLS